MGRRQKLGKIRHFDFVVCGLFLSPGIYKTGLEVHVLLIFEEMLSESVQILRRVYGVPSEHVEVVCTNVHDLGNL